MSAKKLSTSKTKTGSPRNSRRSKVLCAICQAQVVDGKDNALFCEGDCGLWFHRGCASIPPECHKELANSDEPFVCLSCSNVHLRRVVAELSESVRSLKDELKEALYLREKFASIENTVATLKETVESLSVKNREPTSVRRHRGPRSYAAVAKLPHHNADAKRTSPPEQASSTPTAVRSKPSARVKVPGVRRVWGTVKHTSPAALISTVKKLIKPDISSRLVAKRKFKEGGPAK